MGGGVKTPRQAAAAIVAAIKKRERGRGAIIASPIIPMAPVNFPMLWKYSGDGCGNVTNKAWIAR